MYDRQEGKCATGAALNKTSLRRTQGGSDAQACVSSEHCFEPKRVDLGVGPANTRANYSDGRREAGERDKVKRLTMKRRKNEYLAERAVEAMFGKASANAGCSDS